MSPIRLLLLGTAALAIVGCSTRSTFVPKPWPTLEPIPEFTTSNSVYLRNGQSSTDEVLWHDHDFRLQGYANLRVWTDVAISLADRELRKRGMAVTEGASRSLTMTITSVKSSQIPNTGEQIIVVMHVEAGNGYTAEYKGENKTFFLRNLQRQIDGAVMRVVTEAFKDPKIVSYLVDTK
jgi:hypothetical protein